MCLLAVSLYFFFSAHTVYTCSIIENHVCTCFNVIKEKLLSSLDLEVIDSLGGVYLSQ